MALVRSPRSPAEWEGSVWGGGTFPRFFVCRGVAARRARDDAPLVENSRSMTKGGWVQVFHLEAGDDAKRRASAALGVRRLCGRGRETAARSCLGDLVCVFVWSSCSRCLLCDGAISLRPMATARCRRKGRIGVLLFGRFVFDGTGYARSLLRCYAKREPELRHFLISSTFGAPSVVCDLASFRLPCEISSSATDDLVGALRLLRNPTAA